MKKIVAWAFLSGLLFFLVPPTKVLAVVPPTFPSCLNSPGDIKVQYTSGFHGIPGDTASYTGSDIVYSISEATLTQCLCTDTGQGIQTDWWKISSLTGEDVQILKNQGWFYIPDGSLWGLESTPYMAKNSPYACQGGGGGGSGGGGGGGAPSCNDQAPGGAPTLVSAVASGTTVTLTWSPAPDPVSYYLVAYGTSPGNYIYGNSNVGGRDTRSYTVGGLNPDTTYYFAVKAVNGCTPGPFSNELSNTSGRGGAVLGAATEGFAGTGDSVSLYRLVAVGLLALLLGYKIGRQPVK